MTHHDRELSPRERERAPAERPGTSPGGSPCDVFLWVLHVLPDVDREPAGPE